MLSDFFSKSSIKIKPSNEQKDPQEPPELDQKTVLFVFASQAFIRDAKKLMDEANENKTELDIEKLYFLIDHAKQTLDFSLQGLRPFLPKQEI